MTQVEDEHASHLTEELRLQARKLDDFAARIAELEAAIDEVLVVVDASTMAPKLNLRGAGGQTISANIRRSDYLRVDAWPFEKLRVSRAALGEKDVNN